MKRAILAIALLASVNTTAQATISRPVTFEQCLLVIEKSASDLDAKPINIVETSDIRIVEFSADDGSVAIICNRLNQEMVITSSPYQ